MAERVVLVFEMVHVEEHQAELAAIALDPRSVALERLLKVRFIADLRKTIERLQTIDFFVISRFDIGASHELEDGATDAHLIAVA